MKIYNDNEFCNMLTKDYRLSTTKICKINDVIYDYRDCSLKKIETKDDLSLMSFVAPELFDILDFQGLTIQN